MGDAEQAHNTSPSPPLFSAHLPRRLRSRPVKRRKGSAVARRHQAGMERCRRSVPASTPATAWVTPVPLQVQRGSAAGPTEFKCGSFLNPAQQPDESRAGKQAADR